MSSTSYSDRDFFHDSVFADWEDPWLGTPRARSPSVVSDRTVTESDADSASDSDISSDHPSSGSPEPATNVAVVRSPRSPDATSVSSRELADATAYDSPWLPSSTPLRDEPSGHISPYLLSPEYSDIDISPPSSPRPTRKESLRPRFQSSYALSEESGDESDDSGSEYNPPPPEHERSSHARSAERPVRSPRRAFAKRHRSPSVSSSSSKSGDAPSIRHHPYARMLPVGQSLARSKQVSIDAVPDIKGFHCPFCNHYQSNHRRPDLRRHISVHLQKQKGPRWICCGVPLKRADEYGVPATGCARTYSFTGKQLMIGGCGIAFSRKDAYRRHLKAATKAGRTCIGDPDGEWIPTD